jgi:hypothetical protein
MKLKHFVKVINDFGDFVIVKIMKLNKGQVLKSCGGGLNEDLTNLDDFIRILSEVIEQGCTH